MPRRVRLSGFDLLNDPRLNKGTAFSERERDAFALHGLLPPHVGSLEEQVARRTRALAEVPTPLARYRFLRDLQDTNETLFYALIQSNIEDTLPIVYTPTVGEACVRFSEFWHKPRGLFLSFPNRHRIAEILAHPRYEPVRCIVVSDGERILGLGDQGAGGMGIPIGKMSLYTALAGIAPETCLPILLDVGTDNAAALSDPLYLGWKHERVRGAPYDDFVDTFVTAVRARWPHVLLQWEDFAGANAARLLAQYRDTLCTFNDDIQGTAAVAAAALLSAMRITGIPLRDQRIVVFGFGSAGQGIARQLAALLRDDGLAPAEAKRRLWAVDRDGLLLEGGPGVSAAQAEFARPRGEVAAWGAAGSIGLADVVRYVRPTVLIGASGQPGAFTEPIVRDLAAASPRPVIFALSNPTSRCEAAPQQLLDWTDGRALIGTGSPFGPATWRGAAVPIDQTNNSYIFPGLALGIVASRASRVSDAMIEDAARALAGLAPGDGGRLLPPVTSMRQVSGVVARAVAARASREGLSTLREDAVEAVIAESSWQPVYEDYEPA